MKKTRSKRSKNISGPGIATIRKEKGMTQIELAEKCQALGINLDRASIAKIENGLRCVLDYELAGIACVLKTPPARLLNTGVREIGGDETTRRQF
jgi:transcriptional regulator with XRE-family HTH domain